MYMKKLIELNTCRRGEAPFFTEEQLRQLNYFLVQFRPFLTLDPAFDIDDYISEIFLLMLNIKVDGAKGSYIIRCLKNSSINRKLHHSTLKKSVNNYSRIFCQLASREQKEARVAKESLEDLITTLIKQQDHKALEFIDKVAEALFNYDKPESDYLSVKEIMDTQNIGNRQTVYNTRRRIKDAVDRGTHKRIS